MYLLDFFFSVVGVLLSVAFFTLLERKLMGLSHFRKGPNKVAGGGLSQPLGDALKLLSKEGYRMSFSKFFMMAMGPFLGLFLSLLFWGFYNYYFLTLGASQKVLPLFTLLGLMGYSLLLMSWGSNSKYSVIGGHRGVSQMLSYEVCLFIFFLVWLFMSSSYSMSKLEQLEQGYWGVFYSLPLFLFWATLCMAESNRTPFDLAEGESEIVSGFNIEYGGGLFALIFIAEYAMIIVLSFVTSALFLGGSFLLLKTLFFCLVYVWVRCSFPRVRYDLLMGLSWKVALPYSLFMLFLGLLL